MLYNTLVLSLFDYSTINYRIRLDLFAITTDSTKQEFLYAFKLSLEVSHSTYAEFKWRTLTKQQMFTLHV